MSATDAPAGLPRRALIGIFGGLFAGYLGITAVIPVLPDYLREQFHAGNIAVGVVVTVTAVTALLVRPFAGALADRFGPRTVMAGGAALIAAGGALYLAHLPVAALVAVRLMVGVGEAALFTAGAAWVLSIAPQQRRGQIIGLYGVSMWGGISAGTFTGAALQHSLGYPAVWTFSLLAPLIGVVLIRQVPAPAPAPAPAGATSLAGRLLLRPAVLPGLGLALGAAGYAGLAAFVTSHLAAHGVQHGVWALSCFSAVYAGTRLVIGHLPDTLGPRRVATASALGEALGLLVIASARNLPVAVVGAVIMGVGFSLLHPSLALVVVNRTDRSQQGAAIGAYTSFWDLGLAVFGPVTGAVASGFGYPAVFVTGAVCAGAAAVLSLWITRAGAAAPAQTPAEATAS